VGWTPAGVLCLESWRTGVTEVPHRYLYTYKNRLYIAITSYTKHYPKSRSNSTQIPYHNSHQSFHAKLLPNKETKSGLKHIHIFQTMSERGIDIGTRQRRKVLYVALKINRNIASMIQMEHPTSFLFIRLPPRLISH
jgi:hypothetical protein